MLHRLRGIRLFVMGCLLSGVIGVRAQTLGSIAGEVRDTSGAAIAGAMITATNNDTNAQRNAATNEAGSYAFPLLPPGVYTIKAEKMGFKTLVQNKVQIQVQQNTRIDFDLEVGQLTESVEVTASSLVVTE